MMANYSYLRASEHLRQYTALTTSVSGYSYGQVLTPQWISNGVVLASWRLDTQASTKRTLFLCQQMPSTSGMTSNTAK